MREHPDDPEPEEPPEIEPEVGGEGGTPPFGEGGTSLFESDQAWVPRKVAKREPMASNPISLKRRSQIVTSDDIERFHKDVHTPWEECDKPDEPPPGRRRFVLSFAILACVSLVVFLVTRRGGEERPAEAIVPSDSVAYTPQADLREGIAAAVNLLSTSRDPDEVLSVVRHPDRVAARVRALYNSSPPPPRKISRFDLAEDSSLFSSAGSVLLKAVVQFADFDTRIAVVEWKDGRAAIDWEHWVHYQPLPVADFLAGRALPEGSVPEFRVAARWAATFVPSERFGERRYRCLQLRDPRVNGDEFTAYVRRGSAAEVELKDFLQGKSERAVMLALALRGGEVEVTAWVAGSWCRDLW